MRVPALLTYSVCLRTVPTDWFHDIFLSDRRCGVKNAHACPLPIVTRVYFLPDQCPIGLNFYWIIVPWGQTYNTNLVYACNFKKKKVHLRSKYLFKIKPLFGRGNIIDTTNMDSVNTSFFFLLGSSECVGPTAADVHTLHSQCTCVHKSCLGMH